MKPGVSRAAVNPMTSLLHPFLWMAVAGFCASAIVHIASWLGFLPPQLTWALHVGIFVVWLPTVIVANKRAGWFPRRDFWRVALQGCPEWVYPAGKVLVGYTAMNFLIFMYRAGEQGPDKELIAFRGFSGHWMIFYGAAAGALYSATRPNQSEFHPRCPLGHPVSAAAKFCEQCGSAVVPQ